MASRRFTLPEEVDRLAERVWNQPGSITNLESFNEIYDTYMGELKGEQGTTLRMKVFDAIARTHPVVDKKGFKKFVHQLAGGKDLEQDRKKTAKVVVDNKRDYIKRGAAKVDLQGFDTKDRERIKFVFDHPGKVKGRVVFSRKTKIIRRSGTKQTVFRDKKGRFVSVK